MAGRKHVLGNSGRSHRVRPAGVEGEMGDDLRYFAGLDTVVERKVEIIRHLDRLVAGDQGRERDDATVARREAGALPYVAKKPILGVGRQRRRDLAHILIGRHWR
jgi:hypothetical protein